MEPRGVAAVMPDSDPEEGSKRASVIPLPFVVKPAFAALVHEPAKLAAVLTVVGGGRSAAPGVAAKGTEAAALAAPGGDPGVSSRCPSVLLRPIVSVAAAAS